MNLFYFSDNVCVCKIKKNLLSVRKANISLIVRNLQQKSSASCISFLWFEFNVSALADLNL